MTKRAPLRVWLNNIEVAAFTTRNGLDLTCNYTAEAHDEWPLNTPVLSCSLPLGKRKADALPFAQGLLPEGQHRQAMAERIGVAVNDVYALLAAFGRDVAGAVVISTEEPGIRQPHTVRYDAAALEQELANLDANPLGLHDDSELSIAGLADKLLLVRLDDGSWARPVHGHPSTHICKLDDLRRPGLVAAEADCMKLAYALGLTTVEVTVEMIGDRLCLFVSRFDRCTTAAGQVGRIHQEDSCQALGIDPSGQRGRAKYQASGGPSLANLADIVDRYASEPTEQLELLIRIAAFNALIGNADAHGKNLSFLHPSPGQLTLAPLYDTVPTMLWPKLRTAAAMQIDHNDDLAAISMANLVAEAKSWRMNGDRAHRAVTTLAEELLQASTKFEMFEDLASKIQQRCRTLLAS
ncbi:MAG: HipA domain-containing protein [Acidimicrobiales bacterium]